MPPIKRPPLLWFYDSYRGYIMLCIKVNFFRSCTISSRSVCVADLSLVDISSISEHACSTFHRSKFDQVRYQLACCQLLSESSISCEYWCTACSSTDLTTVILTQAPAWIRYNTKRRIWNNQRRAVHRERGWYLPRYIRERGKWGTVVQPLSLQAHHNAAMSTTSNAEFITEYETLWVI